MGIPTDATVVTAEAFSGLSFVIKTRWGLSPPIDPNMGSSTALYLDLNKQNLRNHRYSPFVR